MNTRVAFAVVAPLLLTSCIAIPARTRPGVAPTITTSTSIQRLEDDLAHRNEVGKTTFEYHKDPNFMLGFVEFDDQGWFYNPEQFRVVKREIETQLIRGGVENGPIAPRTAILVVFIHGWRHSADVCDRNVACFREILRGLAVYEAARAAECKVKPRADATACTQRQIAGVFLGWRGSPIRPRGGPLRAPIESLNLFSFYSRKNAAHRIGQAGQVAAVVGWLQALDSKLSRISQRSRLILAGHSFGGAMLFSAIGGVVNEQITEELYRPERPSLEDCSDFNPRGLGDLVVLLNPAFEAIRYQSIHDRMTELRGDCPQRNVLITLAARNDIYNHYLFPIGRTLTTLTDRFRPGTAQRKASRTAVGHYAPFGTHELNANRNTEAPELFDDGTRTGTQCTCSYQLNERALKELASAVYGHKAAGNYNPLAQMARTTPTDCDTPSCIKPLNGFDEHLPFKIVWTDPAIIDGHSDIYNSRLIDFLVRSVAATDYQH